MKNLIVKYWGLVLAVVLLSSLFVSAAPVSAGTLSFSAAANPDAIVGGITSAGTVVQEMAVATDGTTVYAATNIGMMKSTDAGKTWGVPNAAAGAGVAFLQVAVAPGNANMAAAIASNDVVYLTINGGTTWSTLGVPRSLTGVLATLVTDIDISPSAAGVNYIAVSGQAAGIPALYYFSYGLTVPGWLNACTDAPFTAPVVLATENFYAAVKFSPNFNADYIVLVLACDTGVGYALHAASFNVWKFDAVIPSYVGYPAAVRTAAVAAITKASLVMDPLYYGGDSASRLAYVGITTGAVTADSGVFKVADITASNFYAAAWPLVQSLDINADGTKLYVGLADDNNVITISNPASVLAAPASARTTKKPALANAANADNATVRVAGTSVLYAKQGTAGGVSVSTDNGLTFNGISLINLATAAIVDQAVSADATKRYVMLRDATESYLFYNDGTGWVNTYVATGITYVLAPSPANFEVLYIGNKTAASLALLYTPSAGKTNWFTRSAPATGAGAIVDVEALNDTTIYTLTNTAGTATVSKSSSNGFIWTPASNALAAGIAGSDLYIVSEDNLIVSGVNGSVAYSTDNGLIWWNQGVTLAGNTFAAATGLTAGNYIYALTQGDNNLYRIAIGAVAWTPTAMGSAAAFRGNGIGITNGVMYVMYTNAADTEIYRSLAPNAFFAVFTGTTTVGTPTITGAAAGNVGPNALKISNGNQLWFANSFAAKFNVLTITDTLASPTAVPALNSPANGSKIQVNNLTGVAYNTNLVFGSIVGAAAYNIQVAYDDQFVNLAVATIAMTAISAQPVNFFSATQILVIGPTGLVPAYTIVYQPGQTLYWRVQAAAPFIGNWSETFSFSVMPGQAMVAQLASPENGATINNLTPGFSWSPLGGISTYKFELAEAPDFATTLYSTTTTTAGAAIPSTVKLVRGNTYYWRVKALTPTEGEWSTVGNFVVAELVKTTTPPPTQPAVTPTLTVILPDITTTQVTFTQAAPPAEQVVNPSYIWAIIIIGAVLVIAVIVLIVRTRRSV